VMHVTKEQVWFRVLSKSYIASLSPHEQEVWKSRLPPWCVRVCDVKLSLRVGGRLLWATRQVLREKVMQLLQKHDREFCIEKGGKRYARQPLLTEVTWAHAQ
jgi:hypothetical protein